MTLLSNTKVDFSVRYNLQQRDILESLLILLADLTYLLNIVQTSLIQHKLLPPQLLFRDSHTHYVASFNRFLARSFDVYLLITLDSVTTYNPKMVSMPTKYLAEFKVNDLTQLVDIDLPHSRHTQYT